MHLESGTICCCWLLLSQVLLLQVVLSHACQPATLQWLMPACMLLPWACTAANWLCTAFKASSGVCDVMCKFVAFNEQ